MGARFDYQGSAANTAKIIKARKGSDQSVSMHPVACVSLHLEMMKNVFADFVLGTSDRATLIWDYVVGASLATVPLPHLSAFRWVRFLDSAKTIDKSNTYQ